MLPQNDQTSASLPCWYSIPNSQWRRLNHKPRSALNHQDTNDWLLPCVKTSDIGSVSFCAEAQQRPKPKGERSQSRVSMLASKNCLFKVFERSQSLHPTTSCSKETTPSKTSLNATNLPSEGFTFLCHGLQVGDATDRRRARCFMLDGPHGQLRHCPVLERPKHIQGQLDAVSTRQS